MSLGFGFALPAIETFAGGPGAGSALNLDFTSGNNTLSPAITFSRTTNATVTGSNGLIQNAPMNLLTFSEQFDNAAWLKNSAVTVTANTGAAPDGTTTADSVSWPSAAVGDGIYQGRSLTNATYTRSVWVRASVGGGVIKLSSPYYGGSTDVTLSTTWTRVTNIGTATAGVDGLYIQKTASSPSSFEVWGAQLELGSTATTYNPTTVKNLLGFTEHFDNAAWTKSNAFVQTNLLAYSQDFGNAVWVKSNATITANAIVAPNGTGTADKFVEAVGSSSKFITTTAFAASTYTFSIYVKYAGKQYFWASVDGSSTAIYFDVTNGTIAATGAGNTGTITSVGDGWYRVTVTKTTASSFSLYFGTSDVSTSYTTTGDGVSGIYLWGAQLVQGTSAGDYKATYAAAAAVGYTDIYGQPFAQKLVENTAASTSHHLQNATGALSVNGMESFYLKASEKTKAMLYDAVAAKGVGFDLSNGTTFTVSGISLATTYSITAVGNGWYRCAIAAAHASDIRLYLCNASGAFSYTGDGASGIYIFGAQLSDSASVDPYVYQPVAAPTSTAYYGPRFDYDPVTLAPKGLLIEEQRTNFALYSQVFSTGWDLNVGTTVTDNTTVAPDGNVTADTLAFAATTAYFYQSSTVGTLLGATYTFSCWLWSTSGKATISLRLANLGTGTDSVFTTVTLTSTPKRYTVTRTFTGAGSALYIGFDNRSDQGGDGIEGSVQVWGAQLEAGAFATSYIPTVASQVTRAADSATMIGNNFARWYNQTEGTLYGDANSLATAGTGGFAGGLFNISGSGSDRTSLFVGAANSPRAESVVSGSVAFGLNNGTALPGVFYKNALAYKVNDFAFATNGAAPAVDNSGAVLPGAVSILLGGAFGPGSLNGTIKRFAFYPRRLANTELQGITS